MLWHKLNYKKKSGDFYGITPACTTREVTFEFTRNERLLEQFYRIREHCYQKDLNLEGFSGREDEYDRMGHVLIVREGDTVVGGARLIISTPHHRVLLPLEEPQLMMQEVLPYLELKTKSYCEISRLAIADEYRGKGYMEELIRLLTVKAITSNVEYLFAVSTAIQARSNRKTYHHMGMDYEIRKDIQVPHKAIYGDLKMQFAMMRLISEGSTVPFKLLVPQQNNPDSSTTYIM